MSAVPPNLVGPILQSHLMQRQVAGARDAERAQETTAQRQQTSAIDEKDSTVETTDGDTQVHTDSEGAGSQGRESSHPEQPSESAEDETRDSTEQGRLIDLEA
ncbi:MAG: hypothetical protein GXY55_14555 [Phycisphaerae bacterium]|mgnify:CR=1 FL=1|nr:hypothetical protein [Phycisphaerae bacterium]